MENEINKKARWKLVLAIFFLTLLTTVAFLPVLDNGFVNWDDYVSKNHHVQSGLTLEGIIWAFTTFTWSNWHPLTWLSYMFDIEVYKQNPAGHHFSNLILHVANTLLLFIALYRMTESFWRSITVATLFAVHPLHVEPVAWIAGRKDVLSTFFGMLAIIAYIHYVQRPGLWRYVLVFILLALGLMAKSMLVTLPFVLLLLDYWPLQRLQKEGHNWLYLIREKIPLIVLSVLSSFVTFIAQKQGGALAPHNEWDITSRLANAFVSYTAYITKMILPQKLAAFYPIEVIPSIWQIAGSVLLVGVISIAALRTAHRAPYLLIGWLWYLGTLFPVIGLVQSGSQSMADRFTYIPLIGLFMAVTWGMYDLFRKFKYCNIILTGLAVIILLDLTFTTRHQTRYWKNTLSLFTHAAEVTEGNWLAHNKSGVEFLERKRFNEAIYHFEEALRIWPTYVDALNNLELTLINVGRYKQSLDYLKKSLHIDSTNPYIYNNMGVLLTALGQYKAALWNFEEAVRIDPGYSKAGKNADKIRLKLGKYGEEHKK